MKGRRSGREIYGVVNLILCHIAIEVMKRQGSLINDNPFSSIKQVRDNIDLIDIMLLVRDYTRCVGITTLFKILLLLLLYL